MRVTWDCWLLVLFQALGYGRLLATRPLEMDGRVYPVSHLWGASPIHLVGWNVDLDRRTKAVAGAILDALPAGVTGMAQPRAR